ncbi:class I SAM-dependent methyltransferase [Micromonospora globbae]|uniref:class I SAM-dependent methyltransferase n=1 Tax=Micromonospora globbae TaxID=1894969 RepID=UPI003427635C
MRLTGVDFSPRDARTGPPARPGLGVEVDLREGDAENLNFEQRSFDTVVCTFGLCAIPAYRSAIGEMITVLLTGGLLLADHVPSRNPLVRAGQWLAERIGVPVAGEHFLRRPFLEVRAAGLTRGARPVRPRCRGTPRRQPARASARHLTCVLAVSSALAWTRPPTLT